MSNFELVKSILMEFKQLDDTITANSNLFDLGLDSFEVLELCLLIESRTNLTFNDEEIANVKKIQDILILMERERRKC